MSAKPELEERIRRIAAEVLDLNAVTAKAKNDTAALYQEVMAVAGVIGGGNQCSVTITGTVSTNSFAVPIPGATVQAWYPDNTGTMIGSATTDGSGNFSIAGSIPSSGVSATLYLSKTRFTTTPAGPYTLACGSTAVGAISMFAATGYEETPMCADPFADALTLVDTVAGTTTLNFSAGPNTWVGTKTFGGFFLTYTFDPIGTSATEPGIVVVTAVIGGIPTTVATSSTSTVTCNELVYAGSGAGLVSVYPTGTGHWTITDP